MTPFCVLVSDPVLKAVPVPNMAPSVVGRERHSWDALNRWVSMAVVCPFFSTPDGVTRAVCGKSDPQEGRCPGGAGLPRRALSSSPLHTLRDFGQGLPASFRQEPFPGCRARL